MEEAAITIEAEVNLTESEEKVKRAIENIFGSIQTNVEPLYRGVRIATECKGSEALAKFYNLLRRERIRAAARKVLLEGIDGKTINFCLNKQVAYAGHISFSKEEAESPLGPIKVKIKSENPRRLIDWLTSEFV
jgi:predicted RNA binding protein with dsRBD fold (UPF0201 family)